MVRKTIEAYVDVDVDLNDFDDDDLIKELGSRGFTVIEDPAIDSALSNEDLQYLLTLLDKQEFDWYNTRVRDKIFHLRYRSA